MVWQGGETSLPPWGGDWGGGFAAVLLPSFLTVLPLLPIPWAVYISVSAYSRK